MEKHVKANLIWLICLLVAIIVITASIRIPTPTRFTELVSFAATISSLILAIFAIFQGLLSSSESEKAKKDAAVFNAQTSQMLASIDRQMPELRGAIQRVGETVVSGTQFVGRESGESKGVDPGKAVPLITQASPAGLLALEAGLLAFKKGRPFKVLSIGDQSLAWYIYGFYGGIASANWMSFSLDEDSVSFVISSMDPSLLEHRDLMARTFDEASRRLEPGNSIVEERKRILLELES
jgi:hypothetical protein